VLRAQAVLIHAQIAVVHVEDTILLKRVEMEIAAMEKIMIVIPTQTQQILDVVPQTEIRVLQEIIAAQIIVLQEPVGQHV
jgi:hypothetical protein